MVMLLLGCSLVLDRTSFLANLQATRRPSMRHFRLHYFPESGNSYKLALMLTLCGQPFEPVWTDFGGGVTHTPEWRRSVNEMGEIPVLEIEHVRYTQTASILLRLADHLQQIPRRDGSRTFVMTYCRLA
jgi:glutathione S-transferase